MLLELSVSISENDFRWRGIRKCFYTILDANFIMFTSSIWLVLAVNWAQHVKLNIIIKCGITG